MNKRNRVKLNIEMLENRLTPSLTVAVDASGNLTLSGTPAFDATNPTPGSSAAVVIAENAGFMYSIAEQPFVGAPVPVATVFAPGNVTVNFSQSPFNDFVNLVLQGNSTGGSYSLTDGSGNNIASVNGASAGAIGGNVSITNANTVIVGVGVPASTSIGGNLSINDGLKNLITSLNFAGVSIGGNVQISAGNGGDSLNFGGSTTVGGNVTATFGNGANSFSSDVSDTIGGSVYYRGGSGSDSVALAGTIGRNVTVLLTPSIVGSGTNTFRLGSAGTATVVGGNLTVTGGLGHNDVILEGTDAGAGTSVLVAGSAYFNLGGNVAAALTGAANSVPPAADPLVGANNLVFDTGAAIDGASITYVGGPGRNAVAFFGTTNHTHANFRFGPGNDTFTLGPQASNLALLYIDFGPHEAGGANVFNNLSGANQPPLILKNLP